MYYTFDMENQLKRIISKDIIDFKHAATIDLLEESEFIRDFYDSDLYRAFLKTGEGKSIRKWVYNVN